MAEVQVPDYPDVPHWVRHMVDEYCNDPAAYVADLRNLWVNASPETIRWLEWAAAEGQRLQGRQVTATAPRQDAVVMLAQAFRHQLDVDQRAGEAALACTELAARQVAGSYPDLDAIISCFGTAAGQPCAFCDDGDFPHMADPQPVPAWAIEAQQAKLAAQVVLGAVELVYGSEGSDVMLTVPLPPPPPPRQPPADPYEYRPAIPLLSHASVRNRIPLEGHRNRHHRSARDGPLPPAVFAEPVVPEARPRRGRRYR